VSLPLDGVRVLDLSRYLSGPYCTMLLADMGAEVIKLERFPGGDDSRRLGPKVNGESYPFATANRNKKSVAVDLATAEGRAVAMRLAAGCDIVVENFRPDVTTRLGLDYETVRGVRPDVVYCSVTGFGQTGPYRHRAGFDIIAQGLGGFMRMTGQPGEEPSKIGIAINDIAAAVTAAYSVLAAYIHRLRSGEGQYIDISLVDAGLAWTMWESAAYFGAGEIPQPAGTRHRRVAPYQAYRTADGFVTIGANNERLWERLCSRVLDRPELLVDERYHTLDQRMQHRDELQKDIESVLTDHPTEHWTAALDTAGVPGGPVLRYDETLQDPQVLARDMVIEYDHPVMGRLKMLGFPAKMSVTEQSVRLPAPQLGEHTTEVLRELGLPPEEIAALHEVGAVHSRPAGDAPRGRLDAGTPTSPVEPLSGGPE
jgi:crotonobetainyl-CoA:carnitine CoA-transferase CaiB-like acyl-CoA transferase